MLTLLEGPDGSGKSTLFEFLRRIAGETLARHSQPDPHLTAAQKYLTYLAWVRLAAKSSLWCDRAWLSCVIYDPLMTGKSRLTPHHRRVLERLALSAEVVQIICWPPWEVCRENWLRRVKQSAEYVEQETVFRQVYDAYGAELLTGRLPTIGYNYLGGGEQTVAELIPSIRAPVNLGPGVGCYRQGNILLVGDRPNPHTGNYLGPFCATSGCSPWLSAQLDSIGINETSLYWINAYDASGKGTDPAFVDDLEPSQIIALGNQAGTWCKHHGLNHSQIEHPSFWKRFQAEKRYPLLDLLKPSKPHILQVKHDRTLH